MDPAVWADRGFAHSARMKPLLLLLAESPLPECDCDFPVAALIAALVLARSAIPCGGRFSAYLVGKRQPSWWRR
jgi:hypothetical protein